MAFLLVLLSLFVVSFPEKIRVFGPAQEQPYVVTEADSFQNIYQLVFFSNELLDRREIRYMFSNPKNFIGDWEIIQRRIKDLKDAPYLSDAVVFPERSVVNELLMFNRAYRQHIENCLAVWHTNDFQVIKDEIEQLYVIWDAVRDAKCEYYYVHIRRQALLKLKTELDKIDPTWYDRGIMPPHVPHWRFTHIR